MRKIRGYALLCCVLSLIFSFALGATGFFLMGSYEAQAPSDVLAFLFRFFCIATPVLLVITIITVARIKEKEQ